jgi:hypothetical protein
MSDVQDTRMYWYNYQTKEYDYVEGPTTDEEALKYLPQDPASQSLFKLYREHEGLSIAHAMLKVLTLHVKKEDGQHDQSDSAL